MSKDQKSPGQRFDTTNDLVLVINHHHCFSCFSKLQDLLLLEIDEDRREALQELESAHYIYPVDMTTEVLKNEDMRDIICRNF